MDITLDETVVECPENCQNIQNKTIYDTLDLGLLQKLLAVFFTSTYAQVTIALLINTMMASSDTFSDLMVVLFPA